MPSLYLIATPIGNLEDITLRALRLLREVDLIAAEDTRTTRKLLNRYGIKTPLTSYHDHNKRQKTPLLLEALKTKDVALVCEAGTPAISDPGFDLVVDAQKMDIDVLAVPGASAVTSALAISGLPTQPFLFLGFLPPHKGKRRRLLESVKGNPHTLVAFEAPHRLRECLNDMLTVLGDRPLAVCREMTKVHEEVFRGSTSQALAYFNEPRGEFTLVITGSPMVAETWKIVEVERELRRLKEGGVKPRQAVSLVVKASGLPQREVYQKWVAIKANPTPTAL